MLRPLIVIRRTPKIDFMKWHKLGFAFSAVLTLSSIVLFLTVGLNYGIDFVGGTQMEVRVTSGPANLAEMRQKLDALHIGDVSLAGLRPAERCADPAVAPTGGRRGAGAGGRTGAQGAGAGDRLSPNRSGRPNGGQRTDPRRRDRDHPRSGRHRLLYRLSLRMAVRHRRDGLDPARRDYDSRAVCAVPSRIQSHDPGGDPHGRRATRSTTPW